MLGVQDLHYTEGIRARQEIMKGYFVETDSTLDKGTNRH